jgi:hypothetical protein
MMVNDEYKSENNNTKIIIVKKTSIYNAAPIKQITRPVHYPKLWTKRKSPETDYIGRGGVLTATTNKGDLILYKS